MGRGWAVVIGALGTTIALVFASTASGLIDDDAYIFLHYADHLAHGHGLAFNPGEPSAGVTSILWVLVLAGARWLTGADLLVIAQVLGASCFGIALAIMTWTVEAEGHPPAIARIAGLAAALSPVFICQAISGMEVALNMLLIAVAVAALERGIATQAVSAGLALLTRPDNVLLAPVVVAFRRGHRVRAATIVGGVLLTFALPWVAYCHRVGGTLLPPTHIGKLLVFLPGWYGVTFDEFSALSPMARLAFTARGLQRVGGLFSEGQARSLWLWIPLLPFGLPLVGRHLLVPPTLFILTALAYAAGFPLVKLRYFAHLLPWLLPIALVGLAGILSAVGSLSLRGVSRDRKMENRERETGNTRPANAGRGRGRWPVFRLPFPVSGFPFADSKLRCDVDRQSLGERASVSTSPLSSRVAFALFAAILLVHFALCVRATPRYRDWVACEGTKTRAGQWLAEHTAPDARLAAEPIGAIGYHSGRYIIDLGGLITSDIWPVLRHGPYFDADEFLSYLRSRHTDYLIDLVDGPWAGRLLRERPDSLRREATITGPPGCGVMGVYVVQR